MAINKQDIKMGFEWYRSLSKKKRKKFRRNTHFYENTKISGRIQRLLNEPTTKRDLIMIAFSWVDSPEGFNYWWRIYNR